MYNFIAPTILSFICFLSIQQIGHSSHIVGGEISYKFIEFDQSKQSNTFEIQLQLFRDPTGIAYDPFADFGIYRQAADGTWFSYDVVRSVALGPIENITPSEDPCISVIRSQIELELASYTFQIELESSEYSYMISYQKCCRNFSINNIQNAGDIGAVYDIIITSEAQRLKNSSANFDFIPPHFICSNFDLLIEQNATDIDGDSLSYRFCSPLAIDSEDDGTPNCCGCLNPDPVNCTPPYNTVTYLNGFDALNPIGGHPSVTIHPESGNISGMPNTLGAYVVAICVDEFRNGILINTVRRDFEFNVISCSPNLIASIIADSTIYDSEREIEIPFYSTCGDRNISIMNSSIDLNVIDGFAWYIADQDGNEVLNTGIGQVKDLDFNLPYDGTFYGHMSINIEDSCFDTAFFKILIPEPINLEFEFLFDSCVAGPIELINTSTPQDLIYEWAFGNGQQSIEENPIYNYETNGSYIVKLTATNELGCKSYLEKIVDWFPVYNSPPDTQVIFETLCYHDSIFIFDSWKFTSGTYFDYLPSSTESCDSLVIKYEVIFTDSIPITTQNASICELESYNFYGNILTTNGSYFENLSSIDGCDSIISLNLIIDQTIESYFDTTICQNSFIEFNDLRIISEGQYIDSLKSQNGCDSIVILNVEEYPIFNINIDTTICDTETFNYNGTILKESGEYLFEEISETGCDSLIKINLSFIESEATEILDTICFGETYAFGEVELEWPGIYFDTLYNQNGCDSVIILDLEVADNLTRIVDEGPLIEAYGTTIFLDTELNGEEAISSLWYVSDSTLSYDLQLEYLLTEENYIFFESVNGLFCIAKDSIYVEPFLDINLYIPNIFSPNGDGFNDLFYLGVDSSLARSQLFIYDRWGNSIYSSGNIETINNFTGWDGKIENKNVEIGTYTFHFELEFIDGSLGSKTGTITLVR